MHASYRASRERAAIFDISVAGKLLVAGPEAPAFLHNLSTNDIKTLPLGGGCLAYFCDRTAKTLGQARVYHVMHNGKHAFMLETAAGLAEALLKHLDRHLISEAVEFANLTANYAQFHLAGPSASDVLANAIGEGVPDLKEFQHMERDIAGVPCSIRRNDPLGLPGFDILFPVSRKEVVAAALAAETGTREVFETLRVEAMTPVYGKDIDEKRFVMEIGDALKAVSYAKGCYLGQEPIVMSRDRTGFVNRAMKLVTGPIVPASAKLLRDGVEVGVITQSVIESPKFGGMVGIAYIKRGHQDAGVKLVAEGSAGVFVV